MNLRILEFSVKKQYFLKNSRQLLSLAKRPPSHSEYFPSNPFASRLWMCCLVSQGKSLPGPGSPIQVCKEFFIQQCFAFYLYSFINLFVTCFHEFRIYHFFAKSFLFSSSCKMSYFCENKVIDTSFDLSRRIRK